jgi:hypothetical protein
VIASKLTSYCESDNVSHPRQRQRKCVYLRRDIGRGKTSLGQSIDRAVSRLVHDVRDEAEMRGHHRMYVASGPGLLARTLPKAGCMDPVLLRAFTSLSASLQIDVGDNGIGEINKIGQSNYHDVARSSRSGENMAFNVRAFFVLLWPFWKVR